MTASAVGSNEFPGQIKCQEHDMDSKVHHEIHTGIQNAMKHLASDMKGREYALRNAIRNDLAVAMREMTKEVVNAEMSKKCTDKKG